MSESQRRKWLQVHLSTAVLLMFVAGALIWVNVKPRTQTQRHSPMFNPWKEVLNEYGWPLTVVSFTNKYDEISSGDAASPLNPYNVSLSYYFASADFVTALTMLIGVYIMSELWIHRLDSRESVQGTSENES